LGIVLVIPLEQKGVELKAVAIEPSQQKQGVGKRMLAAVVGALRGRGFERVRVGTANAAIGELAFYQKVGFRLASIERDFFTPARGYAADLTDNGIRLRDMVWMELDFAAGD
jgi:ribosomal protein S18 acetylase RimI-like enzyme